MSTVIPRKRLRPEKSKRSIRSTPPIFLDEGFVEHFMALILRGLPPDGACDYLGVTTAKFWEWLKRGQKYVETEDGTNKDDKPYGDFYNAFRRASAKYRLELLDRLHKGKKMWVCWMTILERRDRPNFSKYDQGGGDFREYDPDEKFL